MKIFILAALTCLVSSLLHAQKPEPPATLKGILLEQLKSTHNVKDWFVPVSIAVEGLSPEQARWRDSSGNHSVGMLTYHLLFWNLNLLEKFNGSKSPPFNGDNNETFNNFDSNNWEKTVKRLDSVMLAWEQAIEKSDDKRLQSWYNSIAHMSAHNAYHTGQIIYIRKLQGSWNPEKGVK